MSNYKEKRAFHQLTLTDLFEKLQVASIKSKREEIQDEIDKRNPTKDEIQYANEELRLINQNKINRKNQGLTIGGKIAAFFLPFLLGKQNNYTGQVLGEEFLDKWNQHGFHKKKEEYYLFSTLGVVFYLLFFSLYFCCKF